MGETDPHNRAAQAKCIKKHHHTHALGRGKLAEQLTRRFGGLLEAEFQGTSGFLLGIQTDPPGDDEAHHLRHRTDEVVTADRLAGDGVSKKTDAGAIEKLVD